MKTPWGETQGPPDTVAPGIRVVSTSSHGGVHLSPERQKSVPKIAQAYAEKWCGSRPWYEEDVAACIPILLFPELAEYFGRWNDGADEVRRTSRQALKRYAPDVLAAIDEANSQGDLLDPLIQCVELPGEAPESIDDLMQDIGHNLIY